MAANPMPITRTPWQLDEPSTSVFGAEDVFWNVSSRYFYPARVVFAVFLRTFVTQHEAGRMATLLMGMHHDLDIPVMFFEDNVGISENNTSKNILITSAARFGTSYALLIVSERIDNVLKYAEKCDGLFRADVPILIYVIKRTSYNCGEESSSTVEYSNLLKHLWSLHQTASVIVFVKSLNSCEDEVLFYDPFIETNGSGRGQVYKPSFKGEVDKYFPNAPWNLHGYLLRVAMFPTDITAIKTCINDTKDNSSCTFRGRDGFILDELAKYMNFTPYIMTPSDNIFNSLEFANGTITGPLRDIADGKIDIAMNSRNMKTFHAADIDYVTPVTHFGMMCVLVPKASKVPLWISLFRCFSIALWVTLVATYLLSAILWHSFGKFTSWDQLQKHKHWSTTLSDALNIFLPTVFTKTSSYHTDSERIFVASCMVFSIVITTAFQGSLFNKLKNPVHWKEIDTLEELDRSGLPIIIALQDLYDIFEVIDMTTGKRLSKRLHIIDLTDEELLEIIHRGNSSLLVSSIGIELLFRSNHRYAHLIHQVQECPVAYSQSYMVPRASPYLKPINTLMGRIFEAGFTHKWYYDALYEKYLPQYFLSANSDIHLKLKAYSLSDILIAFVILIFGLSLSALIFLIEYCIKISN
jgi:hypothetical protein